MRSQVFLFPLLETLVFSLWIGILGPILNRKLWWRPNIEEKLRKAWIAVYSFLVAIGKQWGNKCFSSSMKH